MDTQSMLMALLGTPAVVPVEFMDTQSMSTWSCTHGHAEFSFDGSASTRQQSPEPWASKGTGSSAAPTRSEHADVPLASTRPVVLEHQGQ
jgi:hypothetical protein